MKQLFRASIPLAALVLSACIDESVAPSRDIPQPSIRTGANLGTAQMRTIDDDFVDLVRNAPGFGGLYYDSTGTLTVFLKDPSTAPQARTAIAAFLTSHAPPGSSVGTDAASMRVVASQYDFAELANYYAQIRGDLPSRGITITDIDDRANRILIGVLDAASKSAVEDRIQTLGIPASAVTIQQAPPFNVEQTLQQLRRPLVGGLQIAPFICTLGYNTKRFVLGSGDGQRYFVTNSHCTSVFGSVTPDTIGQPDVANRVGVEVNDPALFTNSADPRCPVGRQCRYSDAALVQLDALPTWTPGGVARTNGGNLTITGTTTMQREGWIAYVGHTMTKVGRTTGTTSGQQTAQCADLPQFEGGFDTGRTMLCQITAQYASGGGDSGSPVYFFNSGLYWAASIHWGSDGTVRASSNLNYAWNEFAQQNGQITFSVLP